MRYPAIPSRIRRQQRDPKRDESRLGTRQAPPTTQCQLHTACSEHSLGATQFNEPLVRRLGPVRPCERQTHWHLGGIYLQSACQMRVAYRNFTHVLTYQLFTTAIVSEPLRTIAYLFIGYEATSDFFIFSEDKNCGVTRWPRRRARRCESGCTRAGRGQRSCRRRSGRCVHLR